jgi:hypothetical protein
VRSRFISDILTGSNRATWFCVGHLGNLGSGWTFDDKTVNDTFGGNHGSLRGGASFAVGMTGRALDLNGQDAWAEVPHDASMDAMANGLTAACWFFTRTNTQEFPSFLWKGSQVGWAPGFLFQTDQHT